MTVKTAADLKPADWKYYQPFTSTEDKYSSSTAVVDCYSVNKHKKLPTKLFLREIKNGNNQ